MKHETLRILFIENNELRTKSFKESIEDYKTSEKLPENTEVIVSEHMEDALEQMEKDEFNVIIIDIMLPRDQEKLAQLKELEKERIILMKDLLKHSEEQIVSTLTIDVASIRKKINVINDLIDNEIQDIEGGYDILVKYKDEHKLAFIDQAVLFLSARGQPDLKERCRELIKDKNKYAWLVKPVTDDEIISKMINIL